MKKSILISTLLLLASLVNAQDSKFSIGITGSPDFYNYEFNPIPGFYHTYKTKTNYSIGLSVSYSFTERFSVKSGLLYSTKGYILNYSWMGAEPNDPFVPVESCLNVNYLDIPVLVSYEFLQLEKLSLFSSTGIVTSFLIDESETSTMGDGSEKETDFSRVMFNQSFNNTLVVIDLEVGLNYNFNQRVYVSAAPYLRFGLDKISDEVLESNPLSYGASLGLHVNL